MLTFLSRMLLRIWGWKVEGTAPTAAKYVLIAAPHTSRWDALLLLAAGRVLNMPINWLVAADAVEGALGPIVKRLGAVAVDRSQNTNLVEALVQEFAARDQMALVIAPPGVTRYSDYWRSGFYRIATQANVPLAFSYLDWGTKRLGIGPTYTPTGDVKQDMDVIRSFYKGMVGKFPEDTSKIYLKMEEAVE